MKNFLITLSLAAFAAGSAHAATINIAALKYGNQTTAYVAVKEGFFKKQGLDVKLVEFKSSSQAIVAQRSGQIDVVFGIPGNAFTASERGFDLVALIQNEVAHEGIPEASSIQVLKNSPIKSLKDVEGKKVGASARHSQSWVAVSTAMKRAGGDPTKVQWVEMPVSSQLAALTSGQLDAANLLDPVTTQALRSGKTRVISWPDKESVPMQPQGALWVTRKWLRAHPNEAKGIVAAMVQAIDFMNADKVRATKYMTEYTGIDPKEVVGMPINNFTYHVSRKIWQQTIDMMADAGEIKKGHTPEEYFSEHMKPYIRP